MEKIINEVKKHPLINFLFYNNKKLVLYGGGSLCRKMLEQLHIYNLPIENIIDKDLKKSGTTINGIEIKSIDKIQDDIKNYKFILTTSFIYSSYKDLKNLGVDSKDIYYPEREDIFTGVSGGFQRFHAYLTPLDVYVNAEHYLNVYHLLSDWKSKAIYKNIINFRLYGYLHLEDGLYNFDRSYFNNEFIKIGNLEHVIDVGAYTGDSIISYLRKTNHQYGHIYAIEPSSENSKKIRDIFCYEKNIEVLNVGIGSKRNTIKIDPKVSMTNKDTLKVYTIDELFSDKTVTIIKMDIEGMEIEALHGACEVIKTQKPILAICIYHLVTDIWNIPELIHSILPEYKFCIEQPLVEKFTETVLYAYI